MSKVLRYIIVASLALILLIGGFLVVRAITAFLSEIVLILLTYYTAHHVYTLVTKLGKNDKLLTCFVAGLLAGTVLVILAKWFWLKAQIHTLLLIVAAGWAVTTATLLEFYGYERHKLPSDAAPESNRLFAELRSKISNDGTLLYGKIYSSAKKVSEFIQSYILTRR